MIAQVGLGWQAVAWRPAAPADAGQDGLADLVIDRTLTIKRKLIAPVGHVVQPAMMDCRVFS